MAEKKIINNTLSGHTIKVLFVCLGNICRSPTAHALFQARINTENLEQWVIVDSAGTGGWHVGSPPDKRAQQTVLKHGYDMSHLQARQVCAKDFDKFDFILAMDRENLQHLRQMCPADYRGVLGLFLNESAIDHADEVPDPYYGDEAHFEHAIQLIADAVDGLVTRIKTEYLIP